MRTNELLITTKPCMFCAKESHVVVDEDAWLKFRQGMYVQTAFPTWSADRRELLLTGTHPECWTKLLGDEDD